jgi:beta-N-acetylhexosaminidase
MAAIKTGRLTQKRVEDSLMRLLLAKARLGLATKRLVNVEAIHDIVNSPESNAVAEQVAERSVTLVRNRDAMVPLKSPQSTAFFLLAETRTGVEGQAMAFEIRKRAANATVIQLDATMPDADLQAALQRASGAAQFVIAAFRANVSLGGGFPQMVQSLIDTKKPVALFSMGNPYLLRTFPDVAAYLTGYSTVPPSEIAAVKALFGEIPIGGKLPVTIPGLAKYGDGIQLPASR